MNGKNSSFLGLRGWNEVEIEGLGTQWTLQGSPLSSSFVVYRGFVDCITSDLSQSIYPYFIEKETEDFERICPKIKAVGSTRLNLMTWSAVFQCTLPKGQRTQIYRVGLISADFSLWMLIYFS